MKRIQIRFISLISEKFFLAKRAHPSVKCNPRSGNTECIGSRFFWDKSLVLCISEVLAEQIFYFLILSNKSGYSCENSGSGTKFWIRHPQKTPKNRFSIEMIRRLTAPTSEASRTHSGWRKVGTGVGQGQGLRVG